MRLSKLLNDFVSFLLLDRLLELHCGSSRLDVIPSDLGHPISGECRIGGTCRRHSDAQVSKKGIRHSEVYRDNDVPVLGICVIYIILMRLPY